MTTSQAAMVDLTRDEHGRLHARLLDVVPGRSGTAYAGWLQQQLPEFIAGIEHAALDPFRGYADAIRDELPGRSRGSGRLPRRQAGHPGRRRGPPPSAAGQLGPPRHKDDPLYKIRGLLRHGQEHLNPRQHARLDTGLQAGDTDWEVTIAWSCYQQLRSAYRAKLPAEGRRISEQVITSFPSCPIPEVARLGRTLRAWKQQVLAYFATSGVSNGRTEAVNLLIEKTRRLPPRLPQLRQLPAPHTARRRRITSLPRTPEPCLIPKSQHTVPASPSVTTSMKVSGFGSRPQLVW